ncbi:MAG: 23S rRNA (adenine(2503)-C(2))-methyltransferase RlmN [Bacillota bacterium]|nr:23S rRNA (adenine(2503)-C(2))-methyltransferase RlmN [Bacillota bacterium]
MLEKADIKSYSKAELGVFLKALGEKEFHASQIFRWLHSGVSSFEEMSDLSLSLRGKLNEKTRITCPVILRKQRSGKDGTVKYLWELSDKNSVESVLMSYQHGNSICISTQAGCRMGCAFCASCKNGLARSLEPSEMLDQVIFAQKDENVKISNIVMMGIGEPLDNMSNVIKFLDLINTEGGLFIGHRHISLSTCGLCDEIDILAEKRLQLTLSVSLHAPFNELRSKLMPVNRKYPLELLMRSCKKYFEKTGRRISYEYAMIRGVNDTKACAEKLTKLLKGQNCHVNLILLNRIKESEFLPSSRETVSQFMSILTDNGIKATIRRRLGPDIDASCGQLRRQAIASSEVQTI